MQFDFKVRSGRKWTIDIILGIYSQFHRLRSGFRPSFCFPLMAQLFGELSTQSTKFALGLELNSYIFEVACTKLVVCILIFAPTGGLCCF